jgi:hypothetical protein
LAGIVAAAVAVAAVVAVGAAVVEEVEAGSPLDHGEVLELLSQPVDPEGETLQGRVLVRIRMHLDVKGLANTFKLSEGAPEQLGDELIVVEERFLVGVLGRRLCGFRRRRPPFVPASTAVGSWTPSPPSLGDRRFVVVNREEDEEVKKKMISLWKK